MKQFYEYSIKPIAELAPYAKNSRTHSKKQVNQIEIWKPVPDLNYYEVSSHGRVRSLDRVQHINNRWGGTTKRVLKGRILSGKKHPNGSGITYLVIYVGDKKEIYLNRAVCSAFHGNPPTDKHEAAHLDGNPLNNRPDNLAWKTPKENSADKIIHGTSGKGSKNSRAILDEAKAVEIIKRYSSGESAESLAEEQGVCYGTVIGIASGKIWPHVTGNFIESAKIAAINNLKRSQDIAAQNCQWGRK